eukprot:jgi/Pico_ML_1/51665/g240.t1
MRHFWDFCFHFFRFAELSKLVIFFDVCFPFRSFPLFFLLDVPIRRFCDLLSIHIVFHTQLYAICKPYNGNG